MKNEHSTKFTIRFISRGFEEGFGPIKRSRQLYKNINTVKRHKSLEEIILGINKAYDNFIK